MTRIRTVVPALLSIALVALSVRAQDTMHFAAAGRVSIRHLSAMPWDTAPGIRGKTIIGAVGSLTLLELSPGVPSSPADHYHTREQINVGWSGTIDVQVDDRHIPLTRGTSIVVPSNVVHVARNQTFAPVTYFEFHIVRRPDLIPPFTPIAFPRAPTPVRLDPAAKIVMQHDFDKGPPVVAEGKRSAFTVRVIPSGGALDVADNADEHFWYSLGGGTIVERNGARQTIDANSIVVIPPSSGAIRVTARDKLTLLEFVVRPGGPASP
jgi:mannose-6-phosphate isomerase-like protein (cupin superfamily)